MEKTINTNNLKKGMKKTFMFLIVGVFLISFCSAYLPHQLNTDFNLIVTSNNATQCNLTGISYPNGTANLFSSILTKTGQTFNFTIDGSNFSSRGDTCMNIVCYDSVKYTDGSVCREITYTGESNDGNVTGFYIVSLAILFGLFLLCIFISTLLPSKDATDEEGTILQISQLKHVRPILYGCAWVILLAIVYIISNITTAYIPNDMLSSLFFAIFQIMFWLTIVAIPLWFIWIFTGIFRDKEVKRMIERGVDVKGGGF